MSNHYVYVISDGFCPNTTRHIKIGMSFDYYKRYRQLSTANPNYLYLHRAYEFESQEMAYAIEKLLHIRLGKFRKKGEWFKYSETVEHFFRCSEVILGDNVLIGLDCEHEIIEYCSWLPQNNTIIEGLDDV